MTSIMMVMMAVVVLMSSSWSSPLLSSLFSSPPSSSSSPISSSSWSSFVSVSADCNIPGCDKWMSQCIAGGNTNPTPNGMMADELCDAYVVVMLSSGSHSLNTFCNCAQSAAAAYIC